MRHRIQLFSGSLVLKLRKFEPIGALLFPRIASIGKSKKAALRIPKYPSIYGRNLAPEGSDRFRGTASCNEHDPRWAA
jgi:hypothetical protein